LRVWEARPGGRTLFAHTAPTWFDHDQRPLLPRRHEVQWLVERMKQQIETNQDVLPPDAVAEYTKALKVYQDLEARAR
jgi:hypothetical protein